MSYILILFRFQNFNIRNIFVKKKKNIPQVQSGLFVYNYGFTSAAILICMAQFYHILFFVYISGSHNKKKHPLLSNLGH
jgi:hypothetical protein